MAIARALLSRQSWTLQRCSIAHDIAERAKVGTHVVLDDKLWKCHNKAFLVATGFRLLCRDSGFFVVIGLGLGRGFLGHNRIFFVTTEDRQD